VDTNLAWKYQLIARYPAKVNYHASFQGPSRVASIGILFTALGVGWKLICCTARWADAAFQEAGPALPPTIEDAPDALRPRKRGLMIPFFPKWRHGVRSWIVTRRSFLHFCVDVWNRLGPSGEIADENARSVHLRQDKAAPIVGKQIAEGDGRGPD
jgi:hypothetical protein